MLDDVKHQTRKKRSGPKSDTPLSLLPGRTEDPAELVGREETRAMVIDAIARKDANLSYVRPACEKVNPATGDMVKIPPVRLASTADIIFSVCWITERWLKTATQDELEHVVTGNICA